MSRSKSENELTFQELADTLLDSQIKRLDELPQPSNLTTVNANEFNALIWDAVSLQRPFRTTDLEVCRTLQIGNAVYVCFYSN